MTAAPPRDPARGRRAAGLLLAVAIAWPMLVLSDFRPWTMFEPRQWRVTRDFLGTFLPPSTDAEFLARLVPATLQTLAIATAGIALAALLALPLAFMATRALSVSRIGPGRGTRVAAAGRFAARGAGIALRAIPEVVWALLFVRALGLGPAAGVLAIGITYGGMLAKVWAEILESGDTRPARALLEAGASRSGALVFGLLPVAAQELASYTAYRWECAVRASVIMGYVGAGGLGQEMDQSLKMLAGGEAATILGVFLVLVLLADGLSAALRRALR